MQSNLVREGLRVFFHVTPLIPLGLGESRFAVVAFVVVALTYIKAKKYNAHLLLLKSRDEVAKGAIEDTLKMRTRWSYLTFLKWHDLAA